MLSDMMNKPTKSKEWWGMFVDLSDVDDEPLNYNMSSASRTPTSTMTNKETRKNHHVNEK